ncbi:S8 family serine peptidase [Streptomyces sp. H27-S2]|uniref:S8 family serine peptidase n=1 Tax=Streptomyces antarcticus TaxID=2996458 RepID=UPI00226FCFC1|nr:S8 family serine peptidase [Streptomyces sp. H27-S2]MCY0949236.1 S8 family serine peptidase [Streptomyces sp. H27-S2]
MRHAPFRGPASAAALAALLLSAAWPVPALADSDPVALPVVRTVLEPGEPCAAASGQVAEVEPWPVRALGLARARRVSEGAGVTVAVVGTGVGAGVPALAGRVRHIGPAGADCVGHGSFAAGLIAGAPLPGVGAVGVAPAASLLAVRGTDERGAATPESLAAAIRAAADEGAGVVYVASALPAGDTVLTEAVAYAAGRDALVVAPFAPDALTDPGGAAPAPVQPWYWPAAAPAVLSVMDYGPGGGRPDRAPTAVGADLAAPGDSVVGPGPQGAGHYLGSGSSLAAAHVAGAAALVRSRHPELTAAEVHDRLIASGYPETPPRLDPYAALTAVLTGPAGPVPRPEPARVPDPAPAAPRERALVIAAAGGGLVLLVAAAAVVVPRGRARRWRPPSRDPGGAPGPAAH